MNGNSLSNTLTGGLGDDTYVISTGDVVVEAANAGTDTVVSDVTYTLAANVENLTLTGTAVINGTGNSLNNILTGNSLTNTLTGGLGDDTYVTSTGDVVVEAANAGTETVLSNVTYTLGANVENLTLTGTAAINGTGNSLDNILVGNSVANVLMGGDGNDTYYISAGDAVSELANNGTDTVVTDITYNLGSNLENLILTNTAAINGAGNSLNNTLIGNISNNTQSDGAGNDILQGGVGVDNLNDNAGYNMLDGGQGLDSLMGGLGNELFIGGTGFDTIATGAGYDIIAFIRGDGQDTVVASVGADNTISLGGGINYQNMALSKTGNDLILLVGNGDQITLQNWFDSQANRSVYDLQLVLDANT